MSDPREPGRIAVAVATALVPVYLEDDDIAAEILFDRARLDIVQMLTDVPPGELAGVVGQLGHMVSHLAVLINPEHPYEILQQFAKELG